MSASYESSGVSLAKAGDVVDRLRRAVESTRTPSAYGEFGGFAGLYALDDEVLLAATTDSVGNKLGLCRQAGRLDVAGRDIGAHCMNDVATTGAEPLFMLDYVAAGELDLDEVAELVSGLAAVCRDVGCIILGGETAELPRVYREAELDFVGTCVGLVRRDDLIDGSRCRPGDAVLGLPSTGLHTNGYTLVRHLLGSGPFDPDLLLAPHRLYLDDVRRLRRELEVHAFAHITGGGIPGNLSRVLPAGVAATIDPTAWARPPVFAWLDERGVDEDEQRRVFNLGIGFCAVVAPGDAGAAGFPVIGRLEEGADGVVWADRT
jgi:phosphoribosylformylglycinamidine cyclo-ligase